jgi:hypothetical protein
MTENVFGNRLRGLEGVGAPVSPPALARLPPLRPPAFVQNALFTRLQDKAARSGPPFRNRSLVPARLRAYGAADRTELARFFT